MAKKFVRFLTLSALILAMLTLALTSAAAPAVPCSMGCVSGFGNTVSVGSYGIFSGVSPTAALTSDFGSLKLYPGGIPFGIKFMTEGVVITGFSDVKTQSGSVCPATAAGLRQNDVITKINAQTVTDAAHLSGLTESSGGAPLSITFMRGNTEMSTTLTPALCKSEGKYKSGMYVRDSGAGIGTVTYIIPQTLEFGGLGHGICDADSGKLVSMQRGSVVGVTINGVVKGISGTPGEVRGYFSSGKSGSLLQNTDCGVFGAFAALPQNLTTQPMALGTRNQVQNGKAYILCTLDGTTPCKYDVEISDIKLAATGNKCFTVKITDKALLEKTGGIIQGMSGSPIIQNGKLVGAVTHVLINDPTTGYGIFIENMLNAAQMPMAKAS